MVRQGKWRGVMKCDVLTTCLLHGGAGEQAGTTSDSTLLISGADITTDISNTQPYATRATSEDKASPALWNPAAGSMPPTLAPALAEVLRPDLRQRWC
jgi:hypothetical protein